MSLYFVIWLLISLFLLGFWLWTLYVILNQKRAWKMYAEKRNMRYNATAMFATPSINGAVDGYGVSMFASEHSELDARSNRRMTAIEITLQTTLPFSCVAASGGMVPIVNALDIRHEFKPAAKGWDNSYILRSSDLKLAGIYMNDDRVSGLVDLMKIDKAWVILLFIQDRGVLRLDTPFPIDNPKEIDDLVKKLISVARKLELKKGEDKDLIRKRTEKDKGQAVLDIDDGLLDDDIGLELEE